ncbi:MULTISPECIES: LmeA family phospholipid-binding protein [Gloeobacter]|uniref:Gll0637 protein n=2 Tax=Gloeobacter TaxID=33071 RepID=Q7NMX8_GLOVI|nr:MULTISPECIES: DUF2993 domain-containing protein [Gloeobacter]UFP93258.1 DUF2993 domain-containing protein [Gloeobacter morelensis MG652769]BAC88578.1 gll0637 [Gloeobacter violaceus PCC 7421]
MMLPFPFPAAGGRADAGEQLINSVVAAAIRALLSKVEDLQIGIYCQPMSKLLQGAIDSFNLRGRGMVIKNQFRVESLRVDTDAIAVDLGAMLGGRVRLQRPTEAIASVVLREEDINTAFEAPLVLSKMRGMRVEGGDETLAIRQTRVQLLDDNWMDFKTEIVFEQSGRSEPLRFKAHLATEEQRRIVLDQTDFEGQSEEACQLGHLFVAQFNRIMDLDKFNLDGATLRVHRLRIRNQQLIFEGRAHIDHFPGQHRK